jgi:hypothetical protein
VSTVIVREIPARHRHPHPRRRVVTRLAQAPQPNYVRPQPSSYSQALSEYDDAATASSYTYDFSNGADFTSPSGNIACDLSDYAVECSIQTYEFNQPGPDCGAGIGADLDSSGYAYLTSCSGYFSVHDGAPTLQYGQSLTYGDYACVSESSAISCLNLTSYSGFSLSRAAFEPLS